ncbi:MAG: tail fiber domain-containing protein [Bacteroidota bacterium]
MMKKYSFLFLFVILAYYSKAQNVGINTTGAAPNLSAMLDIDVSALATKTGLLIPRVTLAQKTAMNPLPAIAQGLVVYQTDGVEGFYYNTSLTLVPTWNYIGATTNGWSITGNAGTSVATNFLGTTDGQPLMFKVNGIKSGYIDYLNAGSNDGNTALGFSTFLANTTGYQNAAFGWKALTANTTGFGNAAFGNSALIATTTGSSNTSIGDLSLTGNTTGTGNTAVGYKAGVTATAANANTTGTNNVFVGFQAGPSSATQLDNAIAIGKNALVGSSNTMVLGGTGVDAVNVGVGVSAPAQKLHVSGGSVLTDRAYAASTISIAANTAAFTTGALAASQIRITDNLSAVANGNLTYGAAAIEGQYLWITNADAQTLPFSSTTPTTNIPSGKTMGFVYVFGAWQPVSANPSAASGWDLLGNTGTVAGTNFVGTTDSVALVFKINGHMGGRIGLAADINTNFGNNSLASATLTGNSNSAFGNKSMLKNTTGSGNTAAGANSLQNNTTGGNNTVSGSNALSANSTGGYNTAMGTFALFGNNGSNNASFGSFSMFTNSTGYSNTAIGTNSLYTNSTGGRNTAVGDSAMYTNSSGSNNVASGFASLFTNSTGYNNTANGNVALNKNTSGYKNTAVGDSAMYSNTTGYNNAAVGERALGSNTTGFNNSAIGNSALNKNTTGQVNTAIGANALSSNTTGSINTAVGVGTLLNNTAGNFNTALGYNSLYNNTGPAAGNTGLGYNTLNANVSGTYNTASGSQALVANTTGVQNTANGYQALLANTTGGYNTAIGTLAGYNSITPANSNVSGSFNVFLGYNAGQNVATQLTNAIAIGSNATVNASNALVLGSINGVNGALATVNVGIGTSLPAERLEICGNLKVNGNIAASGTILGGQAITCSSDRRFKKNILPLSNALNDVLKLQGVTYNWRVDEFPEKGFTNASQIGFIAQDIEMIFPQMVFTDAKGYKSVDYSRLTPVLVEALKAQQKIIDTQNKNIEDLKAEVNNIQALLKYNGLSKPEMKNTPVSAEKK